jgi:predicted GH43/DUF377 family glycosyl hydrolase
VVFPPAAWESGRVGAGTPPLRISAGWLEIFHGNRLPRAPGEVGRYQSAALLLDANNPARVLARTHEPLLEPSEPFERSGFIDDVVFPTGIVERGDELLVYYGAGDAATALATLSRSELVGQLRANAST